MILPIEEKLATGTVEAGGHPGPDVVIITGMSGAGRTGSDAHV